MKKVFKEEYIYDEDVIRSITFGTVAEYNCLLEELEQIDRNGYTHRAGKIVKDRELKKLLYDLKVKKELLEELLKDLEKYRI